jgi:carboxyl-terminal processing protease
MLASERLFIPAALAALPVLLLCGGDVGPPVTSAGAKPADLRLIRSVMRQVEHRYVGSTDSETLVSGALKGMLRQLDPHSEYLSEQEYEDMESDDRGEIEGVGLDIEQTHGTPLVVAAIEGGPAAQAGIRAGNRLLKLDEQSMIGWTADDIVHRLRGPAGSKVTLTIARDDQADVTVTLTRALVHFPSVTSAVEGNGIGYARISEFTEDTPAELSDALARLKQGGKLPGFVLDLRNAPGGVFDAAVNVASDFLDGGTVVVTRGRSSDDDDVFTAPEKGDLIRGVPMVALINSDSASAAEIVAGALQDRHRATLLGTRSFGKGTVQTLLPLNGDGALRLTTALYFTPSARSIQGSGITPDVIVPLPPGERNADAVAQHEADLPRALPAVLSEAARAARPTVQAPSVDGPDDAPIDRAVIGTSADDQLHAALTLLQSRNMAHAAASPP